MERLQTKARPDREGLITKATAWRDLASFRAVIAKAVKWGMLEQNPIQQLRMKAAKPRSVVRFLSAAEEQRLRDALSSRTCTKRLWSSTASQLPDTPAQLAAQQGPQGHPIRVPDLCGDLVDAGVPGAQEMDCLLDAQVLEVREWRLSQHAL